MAFGTDKKPGPGEYGYSSSDSQSFFGKSMRIEGEITSDEDVTIEGKVQGQLDVSKTLIIGKEGYVDGKISASVVRISGAAEGNLVASQKLEITSEGKFTGNIFADTIRVAEGAQLKGSINIEDEKAPKPKSKDKKEKKAETPPLQDDTNPIEPVSLTEDKEDKGEAREPIHFPEKKETPAE